MKLVYQSDDFHEAQRLCKLLLSQGVPAKVQENSIINRGTHIPRGNEIWIFINSQYHEAIKLIADPEYQVENKVNIEEFFTEQNEIKAASFSELNGAIIKYGIVASIVLLGLIYVLKT